jgi:hypothetical protein
MAITKEQLIDLGFKPSKRGGGLSQFKKYDTLVYPIDDTDFLYIGYNQFNKQVNNKKIWKSFKTPEGSRFTYCVISLGDTGYNELKDYLIRAKNSIQYKAIPLTAIEANSPMAIEDYVNVESKQKDTMLFESIKPIQFTNNTDLN